MKIAKIIATATLVCATATPALAWGDREQGALVGIGALLLGQQLVNQNQYQQQYAPQPQYQPQYQNQYQQYTPQPQYRHHHHHWHRESSTTMDTCDYSGQRVRIYNEYGRVIGFRYC